MLLVVPTLWSCVYHELDYIPPCSELPLSIQVFSKQDNDFCGESTGSITVTTSGGTLPVRYRININGLSFQESGNFTNLQAGTYNVEARDNRNCSSSIQVEIEAIQSDLRLTAFLTEDNECLTDNGTASFEVSGGTPPYQFLFAGVSSTNLPSLTNIGVGTYVITAVDATECSYSLGFTITRGLTGVGWKNDIKPIIETRCAKSGCHIAGTGRVDFTSFNNVKAYATSIKLKTTNRSMPYDGSLEESQIQKIACWVDDGALDN